MYEYVHIQRSFFNHTFVILKLFSGTLSVNKKSNSWHQKVSTVEQIISDLAELKAKVDQKDDQIRDLKAEIVDLKVNFRIYFTH